MAEFLLGICYDQGLGVEIDHHESIKWYKRGAGHGEPQAQLYLGLEYVSGENISRQRFAWRRHCLPGLEYGVADAAFMLGKHYFDGLGVQKDDPQSFRWLSIALALGHGCPMRILRPIRRI